MIPLEVETPEGVEVVVEREGGRVRVRSRATGSASIVGRLVVSAAVPATDPWWLIPGAFYGENRPAANDRLFPRYALGEPADALTSAAWEFRADRAATPAVFVWGAKDRGGVALAADETTALGLTGLGFVGDGTTARVHLSFPFREHPVTYYGDADPRPAESAEHVWEPGIEHVVDLRVFDLPADRHAYATILREVHAASSPTAPLRPWISVPDAADLAAEGMMRWHYDPDPGILRETAAFDRELNVDGRGLDRDAMHVGWVSGVPWASALLRHGIRRDRPDEIEAAVRVMDLIAGARSPSGTLWGVWYREHGWSSSWTTLDRGLHSRTLAEAVLFLWRSLGVRESPLWRDAVRANLDVVVARQRADGALGSVHHADTGEVLSWAGGAGLTWVAPLAEAAALDPRYLPAARRAGSFYAPLVTSEFLHGAPEDVDLAPSSEDGYVALMSYLALHRATGEERWLDLARRAAEWMLTFRYSYDVAFPDHTLLHDYDFGTRGADQASPSNQHLHAYGLICTAEMLELSRATGDPHFRDRARETLACFRQFVAREDGDFNAYRGMVSERYYQTSCFQPKGMLLTLSHAWSVGVLLLACEDAIDRQVLQDDDRSS